MKIQIIIPGTGKENLKQLPLTNQNLGACCISSKLNREGHETEIIQQILGIPDDDLITKVKKFSPDAIGFSAMTYNFGQGQKLAKRIKNEYKDIPIIFGGDHVSGCAAHYDTFPDLLEKILQPSIDYIVIGEGEITITELLKSIEGKKEINEVDGIAYKKDGKIIFTKTRERIQNLDELPNPDRSSLAEKNYKFVGFGRQSVFINYQRGCRFRCTFCSTPVTWGKGQTTSSAKYLVDEIEEISKTYGLNHFFICEEDFMSNKERVYQICEEIKTRDLENKITWFSFARVTDVDKETLKTIKSAGCSWLFYGIESMNQNTLKKLHKGINPEKVREVFELTKETGLNVWGTLMMGYYWEDEKSLLKSLEQVKTCNIDYIYPTFITPFPGTPFYKECREQELLLTENFDKFNCSEPIIKSPIQPERLEEIYYSFLKEFYTNPNYILRMKNNIKEGRNTQEEYDKFFLNLKLRGIF
jgi:anaerobic magnesium-protoporphyrin IX monomethyl ester cyclase